MNPENSSHSKAPRSIKVAAGVLALEALAPLGLAVWAAITLLTGAARSLPMIIAEAVFFLAAGLWLILVSARLVQGRSWARSAAVFWQLVQLAVASASFSGQFANPTIGGSLIVSSLTVGVFLFSRESIAWIGDSRD